MQGKKKGLVIGAVIVAVLGAIAFCLDVVANLTSLWGDISAPFCEKTRRGMLIILVFLIVACCVVCRLCYQQGRQRAEKAAQELEDRIKKDAENTIREAEDIRGKLGRVHDVIFVAIDSALSAEE